MLGRLDRLLHGYLTGFLFFFSLESLNSWYTVQANEMLHHKANLNGYLSYHTGQSLEKINQDTDRDFFMSAKEAKEYGLIDGVILNPLKALQPLPVSVESTDESSEKAAA